MPAKSARQYKFMQAISHGAESHKGIGPSKSVAEEFIKKTPKAKRILFTKKKSK